jgi:hypothetical protein
VPGLAVEDWARNATPHLHVFFTRPGAPHDPNDDAYSPRDVFGGSMPLIKYYPKKKASVKKNLLGQSTTEEGEGEAAAGEAAAAEAGARTGGKEAAAEDAAAAAAAAEIEEFDVDAPWLPYFKPNVTVSFIDGRGLSLAYNRPLLQASSQLFQSLFTSYYHCSDHVNCCNETSSLKRVHVNTV